MAYDYFDIPHPEDDSSASKKALDKKKAALAFQQYLVLLRQEREEERNKKREEERAPVKSDVCSRQSTFQTPVMVKTTNVIQYMIALLMWIFILAETLAVISVFWVTETGLYFWIIMGAVFCKSLWPLYRFTMQNLLFSNGIVHVRTGILRRHFSLQSHEIGFWQERIEPNEKTWEIHTQEGKLACSFGTSFNNYEYGVAWLNTYCASKERPPLGKSSQRTSQKVTTAK